ncbi:SatD family protein [Pseudomonas oryzihabitans]|uniref:SatD family protein n=1 Tax=Pseudomonas oryzihabitans TaxID=47885 RepID=UPI002893DFC2|nr:SatD family protein [Pseudomonas oryzihabitans]MDT3721428.1 SatD family protein [Pseudomonas oryzihabitans]
MKKAQTFAVLMGDLVHSEGAADVATLHRAFNESVAQHNRHYAADLASPLTITLGDEFQGLLTSLDAAARLLRAMRLDLLQRAIDCRFVLGLVEIETAVNREQAWNMMGPGLSRARHKLNEKPAISRYGFSLSKEPLLETALEALGVGLTVIESGWTQRQLSDIAALLGGQAVAALAEQRRVSVKSIYKIRTSGHFDAYVHQWNAMLEVLAALDGRGDAR